jgi:hypothetical protein
MNCGPERRWRIGLLAGALVAAFPRPAAAQAPAAPAPVLTPRTDPERLAFIHARLDAGRDPARTWWISWLAGFSTLAVGQGTAALHLRGHQYDDLRPPLIVGAAGSAVGAIGLLPLPWPTTWATHRDPDLASAEHRLYLIADAETLTHSWKSHLAVTLVNVTGSLVLWLVFRLPLNALTNLVVGMAVGELQLFTQPVSGIRDAAEYRQWNESPAGNLTIAF